MEKDTAHGESPSRIGWGHFHSVEIYKGLIERFVITPNGKQKMLAVGSN